MVRNKIQFYLNHLNIKSNVAVLKSSLPHMIFVYLYKRSNEQTEIKMSAKDEQDEEYSVKSKRKKKTSTKENYLLHCREDCDFDDIMKLSKTSWIVSSQLILKAYVKRNIYLIRYLLKESHNSQIYYFINFRLQRKLPKFDRTRSRGDHRKFASSKALMKFDPQSHQI